MANKINCACPFCGAGIEKHINVFEKKDGETTVLTIYKCKNELKCGAIMSFSNPLTALGIDPDDFFERRTQIEFDMQRKEEEQ